MGKDIDLLLDSSPEVVRSKLLPLLADICGMWSYAKVCERMSQYADCKRKKRKELAETLVCLSDNWQRCKPVEDTPQWNGYAEGENRYWNEPKEAFFEYQDQLARFEQQKEWENRLPLSRMQVEWLQRWAEEPQQCDEAPEPVRGGAVSGTYHYSLMWSNDELRPIYDQLVNNGYFAPQTTFGQWVWVCTGKGTSEAHTAIVWLKTTVLLACLVVAFCGVNDDTKKWDIAKNVFRLADGETPKVSTMKSYVSATKGKDRQKTDDWRRLENLLIIDSQPPKEFGVV